jgi:hypothetical protein
MSPVFGRQCIRCGDTVYNQSERCPACNDILDRVMAGMAGGGWLHSELATMFGFANGNVVTQRLRRFRRKQEEASHAE